MLDPGGRRLSSFSVLGLALVMLVLCVGLVLLQEYGWELPQAGPASVPTPNSAIQLLASDPISRTSVMYLTLVGAGGSMDLYRHDPTSGGMLINLTKSVSITETWPVVSPDGSFLAYYGVGNGGVVAELYTLSLPDGLGIPITTNTGETDLHDGFEIDVNQQPLWSPDGDWLAFLARQVGRKGNAIELYIVQSDGSALQSLTQNGNRVSSPVWLNNDEIAYVEARGNGKAIVYRRNIQRSPITPMPVATLELPLVVDTESDQP